MSKPLVQNNAFFSFAVMLLMIVAVVAGQSRASLAASSDEARRLMPSQLSEVVTLSVQTELHDTAPKVSKDMAADLTHFRGEDE